MAMVEDREPGAMMMEDEPFDVVRANSSLDSGYGRSPSNEQSAANSAGYDPGDLPTLSRTPGPSSETSTVDVHAVSQTLSKTSDLTRNVTGGQSSYTRPLSPPSRAGLDEPEVYQRKQQQQRRSDDSEAYSAADTGTTPSTLSRGRSYHSEMPMDERQEYEDDMKALALCDYGDGSQGVPEFCDAAMTAVNEMCAGGGISESVDASPSRVVYDGDGEEVLSGNSTTKKARALALAKSKKPSLKLGEKHSPSKGVEEQTAIEVEYVEPLYRGKTGSGETDRYTSPKRKNALLKAMTRKARDDWKGKGGKEEENPPPVDSDNVYASFSNAEKRKFLQLINGGSTPFDATSRVLKERLDGPKDGGSVADSSVHSEDPSPAKSTGKKSRKLAFWKRKPKKEAAPRADPPSGPPSDPGSPPNSPPTSPPRGVIKEIYEDNDDDEEDDDASNGDSSYENVGDEIKQFLREEAASVASNQKSPLGQPSQLFDGDQRFEKSGISYYDAVRKDVSMDEDEPYDTNEEPADGTGRRNPRKIKIPKSFRGSLSKLRDRNRAIPVPEDDDDDEGNPSIPTPSSKDGSQTTGGGDPAQSSFDEEKKAEDDSRTKAAVAAAIAGTAGVAAAAAAMSDDAARDTLEDAMTAKLLSGIVTQQQMADVDDEQPQGPSPEEIVDDLNMDAYLGSTETMSRAGVGTGTSTGASGSFDATSVVSGRSYRTSGTNYSTRSRRPGQGKIRMQQGKSILNTSTSSNKTHGWQASIEAAAAKAGKSWDRENGWTDYVDPVRVESDDFYKNSVELGVEQEPYRDLPTDPAQLAEWRDSTRSSKPPEAMSVATSSTRKSRTPSRKKYSPQRKAATTPKDERPRGWAATMKAATAKLNMQGKKWDPEKGWRGLSQEEAMSVTGSDGRHDADVNVVADSDTQDFGTLGTVEKLDQIANKQDKSMQFLSEDEDAENNPRYVGEEETLGDLSSSAGKSKNSGRYIQIAATGSVREFQRQQSQNINVEKQHLNQQESQFFPEGSQHGAKRGPVDLDDIYDREQQNHHTLPDTMEKLKVHSGPNANSLYQKIYETNSNNSFDDGAATDFSYDEADQATEIGKNTAKAVPRLKIKIRDMGSGPSALPPTSAKSAKSPSEASFESSGSSIPILNPPTRDTSPIRGNKGRTNTPPSGQSKTGEGASERFATTPVMISPSQDNEEIRNEILYEEPSSPRRDSPSMPPVNETIESPVNVREVANSIEQVTPMSPGASKMSQLHSMWEKRTKSWDERESPILTAEEIEARAQNPEWKQFLVKKVQAESAAARGQDGRDTMLEFSGDSNQIDPRHSSTFDNISELSPIRHNLSDSDFTSEASTSVIQGTTFLQRLQACAAPIVTKGSQFAQNTNCNSGSVPISAHLAFLRNNPGVGGSPDKKAGRPDVIAEGEEDETTMDDSTRTPTRSISERSRSNPRSRQYNTPELKERSRSNPRSRQQNRDDMSSVVSEGFGAKSAYLEALAMKAAVSGGSKKKKKKRPDGSEASAATGLSQSRQSPGSDASAAASGTSKHSDKFQQFLDRRASKEGNASRQRQTSKSPGKQRQTSKSPVQDRAEQYASDKVNVMMDSMAGRSTPTDNKGRTYEETGAFPTLRNVPPKSPANEASRIAAEELAAARVEAMMQRLSSENLEDHEAEI